MEVDCMNFLGALEDGAHPDALDESGNPVWQLLLMHPKSYFVDESERALMLKALLETGHPFSASRLDVMIETIEDEDLSVCAVEFVKASLVAPIGSSLSDAKDRLNTDWWGECRSSIEADFIDKNTQHDHPLHKSPRL